jgi:hypothetical protein
MKASDWMDEINVRVKSNSSGIDKYFLEGERMTELGFGARLCFGISL